MINYLSKLYFDNGKLTIKAGTSLENHIAKNFTSKMDLKDLILILYITLNLSDDFKKRNNIRL